VDPGILIAQLDHGPGGGMAVVHLALVAIIALGGLGFVLVRGARRGSAHDRPSFPDRGPEDDGRPEA
jgi:hypothetical protein